MKHLVLIGFMGSGKTTLSFFLSSHLHYPVFSTDERIKQKTQMSIQEIFQNFGEEFFRLEESNIFGEIKDLGVRHIIDCGGGFGAYQQVNQLGNVVFLDIDFEEIVKRLKGDTSRPLFNLQAKELFLKRREIYRSKADLVLEEKDSNHNLEKIKQLL